MCQVEITVCSLCPRMLVKKLIKNVQWCENCYKSWFLDPMNIVSLEHSFCGTVCDWFAACGLSWRVRSDRIMTHSSEIPSKLRILALCLRMVFALVWAQSFSEWPEAIVGSSTHGTGDEESGDPFCLLGTFEILLDCKRTQRGRRTMLIKSCNYFFYPPQPT